MNSVSFLADWYPGYHCNGVCSSPGTTVIYMYYIIHVQDHVWVDLRYPFRAVPLHIMLQLRSSCHLLAPCTPSQPRLARILILDIVIVLMIFSGS